MKPVCSCGALRYQRPLNARAVSGLNGENGVVGAGVAYVDVHLLASAFLDGRLLWSADGDVQRIADRLGVGFRGGHQ